MTAESLARALGAKRTGANSMAKRPAHEDSSPSLAIRAGKGGKVLVHCFAGCPQPAVIAALRARGLWPDPERSQWTPEERRAWEEERREIEQHLPDAELWRHSALSLGEEVLEQLKLALTDRSLPWPAPGAIHQWTRQLSRWQSLTDASLVREYRDWVRSHPRLAAAMVRAARERERELIDALKRYLREGSR